MIAISLLLIGLFLILAEFYLPGGILAFLAGLSILTAFVIVAREYSLVETLVFILSSFLAIYGVIRFAIWKIVHAKPDNSIYLKGDQEGYKASGFDSRAIGKIGIVLSDLKPGGYILVDGEQHQAISISGYIPKGDKVIVLSGQEESLMVKTES